MSVGLGDFGRMVIGNCCRARHCADSSTLSMNTKKVSAWPYLVRRTYSYPTPCMLGGGVRIIAHAGTIYLVWCSCRTARVNVWEESCVPCLIQRCVQGIQCASSCSAEETWRRGRLNAELGFCKSAWDTASPFFFIAFVCV